MLEMLCVEHQLIMFKEFEARRSEFLKLEQGAAYKKPRSRTTPKQWDAAITKKMRAQLDGYKAQRDKVSALKKNILSPEL